MVRCCVCTNGTVWMVLCCVYKHHCMDGPLLCLQRTLHGWSSAMATNCMSDAWSSALYTKTTVWMVLCYVYEEYFTDGPLLCLKTSHYGWFSAMSTNTIVCMVLCCVYKHHCMHGPLLCLQTPLHGWSMSTNTTAWIGPMLCLQTPLHEWSSAVIALIIPTRLGVQTNYLLCHAPLFKVQFSAETIRTIRDGCTVL